MTRDTLKIGAYVLAKNAKQTYSVECYDVRINAGMAVCRDILARAGFTNFGFASAATVTEYDVIMFSMTSDCDWWSFIAERSTWERGDYRVVIGGQGVLNVRPFLGVADYFMLGRAEGEMEKLFAALVGGDDYESEHVVCARTFSMLKRYTIAQVDDRYPHAITLPNGGTYREDVIGCNHKCLFCGYTWHRRHAGGDAFSYEGLWNGGVDRERAIIDMHNGIEVDFNKLRTTAIDGLSERIRVAVNKRITRDMLRDFLRKLSRCEHPHQVKIYNIVGYPSETDEDWMEFLDDVRLVDGEFAARHDKQTCLLLHSTPFRAMPATPLACAPMSLRNYRGEIARVLGGGRYKGNIFYQGNALWCVESMGTESLSTVALSAIVWRGTESDADNIVKLSRAKKFWSASGAVKIATLEKYFDLAHLFGAFTPNTLPTRNIGTYCAVEKMWGKTRLEVGAANPPRKEEK